MNLVVGLCRYTKSSIEVRETPATGLLLHTGLGSNDLLLRMGLASNDLFLRVLLDNDLLHIGLATVLLLQMGLAGLLLHVGF